MSKVKGSGNLSLKVSGMPENNPAKGLIDYELYRCARNLERILGYRKGSIARSIETANKLNLMTVSPKQLLAKLELPANIVGRMCEWNGQKSRILGCSGVEYPDGTAQLFVSIEKLQGDFMIFDTVVTWVPKESESRKRHWFAFQSISEYQCDSFIQLEGFKIL